MTVLVVGSGGREHALVWRLAADPQVARVVASPGNPGMAGLATLVAGDPADPAALVALARRERAELTVIGPELPLSRGVADAFAEADLPLLGPTRAAAALECSKAFAKAFMRRHGVPTARHVSCETERDALALVDRGELGWPLVIKADGLAAGKGVVVSQDAADAAATVTAMMHEGRFGEAGRRVVLEECLSGPELSYFVLSDGERVLSLGSAQDHKRALDADRGPNTGGMGAFAPSPLCDEALERRILQEIVEPVIAGMRAEGYPYRGFLYCGLMLTAVGPKVIEFNVRFGDPEAQVLLPLLEGEVAAALAAAADGDLRGVRLGLRPERTVGVVLASGGYPDAFETGKPIRGLASAESVPGVLVFHAGTKRTGDEIVTAGGRVLTVVGRAEDYATAMSRAYEAVDRIGFDGKHARRDIGRKALSSEF